MGVTTIGDATRYPDALVTCAKLNGTARTVPGAVVIFEIISLSSGGNDRIVKLREYGAVASIRRCVTIESVSSGVLVFHRAGGLDAWTALPLGDDDGVLLPEIGCEFPVSVLHEGVELAQDEKGR